MSNATFWPEGHLQAYEQTQEQNENILRVMDTYLECSFMSIPSRSHKFVIMGANSIDLEESPF
jgi:hypothetical protein